MHPDGRMIKLGEGGFGSVSSQRLCELYECASKSDPPFDHVQCSFEIVCLERLDNGNAPYSETVACF